LGAISVIFGSQSHYGFITAREMKHTSQYGSDKTTDGKMAQHHQCCFPNSTKPW